MNPHRVQRMVELLALALLLTACGHGRNESRDTETPIEQAQTKRQIYASLYDTISDDAGLFDSNDCDALLFNALYGVTDDSLDIESFRDKETGQWFRTPAKTCYEEGRSGSTVSRDMLIGMMWWAWSHERLDVLEDLRRYGQEHDWVMGQGSLDRTYFTPNFQKTLYVLLGRDYKGPPEVWIDPKKDHQRHVVALNIILRGERQGQINDEMLGLLELFHVKNPNNALFSYGAARFTDGNQAETINILLNPNWFAADRLPRSSDRCGRWLWERDDGHENWRSCEDGKTHSGGDLIFIAWLLDHSQGKSLHDGSN